MILNDKKPIKCYNSIKLIKVNHLEGNMNKRDNLNLGDEIKNKVQDALNNKDFNKLSQDIKNISKNALDEFRSSFNGKFNNENNQKKNWNGNTDKDYKGKIKKHNKIKNRESVKNKSSLKSSKLAVPVGQISGGLLTVFGSIVSVGFGIAIFVMIILGFAIGRLFHAVAIGLLPFFIIGIILLMNGINIRNRLKRFEKYMLYMKGEKYYRIGDLSLITGLSKKFIAKDLSKMISAGMFPQGHIDDKGTWFMLNNESYYQYLELQKNIEIKNLEKERYEQSHKDFQSEKERSKTDRLTPEMRKSIDEGRKLVLEIKETNIAIPGDEISLKLDRLEEITGKIFDYIEVHPEKFTEIRKFTEYFLPTTLKLLEAYKRLDYQSVQGDNILSAKKEIEQSLDTINLAFENLLDDLFQDITMDISTDISVLKTMLAQEGLTNSDMRTKNKTEEEKE